MFRLACPALLFMLALPFPPAQGPSMIEGNYPPAFPLKHQQKDMR